MCVGVESPRRYISWLEHQPGIGRTWRARAGFGVFQPCERRFKEPGVGILLQTGANMATQQIGPEFFFLDMDEPVATGLRSPLTQDRHRVKAGYAAAVDVIEKNPVRNRPVIEDDVEVASWYAETARHFDPLRVSG